MNIEKRIIDGILSCCHPQRIILYSEKTSLFDHALRGANFCIVVPTLEKKQLTQKLYLRISSEIPFNLLLYTPEEWARMTADPASYASHIAKKGKVLYEQT